MNRSDFQDLAQIRLAEAAALLQAERFDGAYYLAGYAVECALKACIAKGTQLYEFPDRKRVEASHSHNLRELMRVAGLENARVEKVGNDPEFRTNWDIVQSWSEQSRYRRNSRNDAHSILDAVSEQSHGVMPWITLHW